MTFVTVLNEIRQRGTFVRPRTAINGDSDAWSPIACRSRRITRPRDRVFSRRLFIVVSAMVAALGVALVGASLLDMGGDVLQTSLHNVAESAAALFACALALLAASRSRGRRRLSWVCWSAFAVLEAVADWNALASHATATFPSWTDLAVVVQLPLG